MAATKLCVCVCVCVCLHLLCCVNETLNCGQSRADVIKQSLYCDKERRNKIQGLSVRCKTEGGSSLCVVVYMALCSGVRGTLYWCTWHCAVVYVALCSGIHGTV